MNAPPPGYVEIPAPSVAPPGLASDWAAKVPDPLTYTEGLAALDKVKGYAWGIVDKICKGTCPPPQYMVPQLVKRLAEMKIVHESFAALVRRGAGKSKMPAKVRTEAVNRGQAVINEADRIWAATVAEDTRVKEKIKSAFSFGKFAVGGILVVAGIFGVAAVVSHVSESTRNVRLTVRGYPRGEP